MNPARDTTNVMEVILLITQDLNVGLDGEDCYNPESTVKELRLKTDVLAPLNGLRVNWKDCTQRDGYDPFEYKDWYEDVGEGLFFSPDRKEVVISCSMTDRVGRVMINWVGDIHG